MVSQGWREMTGCLGKSSYGFFDCHLAGRLYLSWDLMFRIVLGTDDSFVRRKWTEDD